MIPSSRFLEAGLVGAADLASAATVVELGPGSGGTTTALLAGMAADARLLAVEINPHLHRLLAGIDDDRLVAHCGSATALDHALRENGLPAPDVVVSGIPFSRMPADDGRAVIEAVRGALAPGGRFVAYQLSDRVARLATPVFGAPRIARWEWRNIPPLRLYVWDRPAG
ncbi:hypothetical protein KBTX_00878 [wastewater metagenome]|uniref:Uncharacterized protein n=3 Tax=root TaxID=1 RepID=A0A5B8R7F9_9ZZZZ|nr:hypothetical protein KBTEX_00878 [uncultured organism]